MSSVKSFRRSMVSVSLFSLPVKLNGTLEWRSSTGVPVSASTSKVSSDLLNLSSASTFSHRPAQ